MSHGLESCPHSILVLSVRYLCRILFQRGVYPEDDFHMVKKYGQTVLVTQDLALENYLDKYVGIRGFLYCLCMSICIQDLASSEQLVTRVYLRAGIRSDRLCRMVARRWSDAASCRHYLKGYTDATGTVGV